MGAGVGVGVVTYDVSSTTVNTPAGPARIIKPNFSLRIRDWIIDHHTAHIYHVSLAGRESTDIERHAVTIGGVCCEACQHLTCGAGCVEVVCGHGGRVRGGAGGQQ